MPGPLPLTGTYPAAAPPDPASLPPRRILAIWLRDLAMDRWRLSQELGLGEGADASPLALVAESARGVRITAANAAGLAAGANPGTALADARTLCPALATAPSDPAGDLAFLEKLALSGRLNLLNDAVYATSVSVADDQVRQSYSQKAMQKLAADVEGVSYLSFDSRFQRGNRYIWGEDGVLLYNDSNHLSAYGAESLEDAIAEHLNGILSGMID